MNYGYNSESKNWNERKKGLLAKTLITMLNLGDRWVAGGKTPYIEVDGLYKGVRIRKITYLSNKEQDKLVHEADKIYKKVMGDD